MLKCPINQQRCYHSDRTEPVTQITHILRLTIKERKYRVTHVILMTKNLELKTDWFDGNRDNSTLLKWKPIRVAL